MLEPGLEQILSDDDRVGCGKKKKNTKAAVSPDNVCLAVMILPRSTASCHLHKTVIFTPNTLSHFLDRLYEQ